MRSFPILKEGMGWKAGRYSVLEKGGGEESRESHQKWRLVASGFALRVNLWHWSDTEIPIVISSPAWLRKMGDFLLSGNPFRMRFKVIVLKMWTISPSY